MQTRENTLKWSEIIQGYRVDSGSFSYAIIYVIGVTIIVPSITRHPVILRRYNRCEISPCCNKTLLRTIMSMVIL